MKDLTIANGLIEKLAKQNKYISAITLDDFELFQKFFQKEKHTYGNSWTYITQGMYGIGPANLGYKYYDGTNLSAVCIYPKIEDPNLQVFYWVRPMGPSIFDVIVDFSTNLLKEKKIPTYVKKIFKDQYDFLKQHRFKDTTEFPWHSICPSEDDTYPEIILDIKQTLHNSISSRSIKNTLKRYRRISKEINVQNIITTEEKEKGWIVGKNFFRQKLSALGLNISSPEDYFNPIFLSTSEKRNIFLIMHEDRAIGIFDLEKLQDCYYTSYMGLMMREKFRNLNEFSVIYSAHLISQQGGTYLNLGGSEIEGLDEFKNKFVVAEKNQMYWASLF